MKIFFFTTVFAPSVGGIPQVVEILCNGFAAQGHEVRLASLTPCNGEGRFPYPVLRRLALARVAKIFIHQHFFAQR